MRINKRGYWENMTTEGHGIDEKLMSGLRMFFNSESRGMDIFIADIGCGNGYYTNNLNFGNVFCQGFDGNPYTEEFAPGCKGGIDFSIPQDLGWEFEWVLSLEVGEHIPREFEEVFLTNLTDNATIGIVLSWAIPGQGGDGHVNCRPNDYIISKMFEKGFGFDSVSTERLRNSASVYPYTGYWFRQTLLVFRRIQ